MKRTKLPCCLGRRVLEATRPDIKIKMEADADEPNKDSLHAAAAV